MLYRRIVLTENMFALSAPLAKIISIYCAKNVPFVLCCIVFICFYLIVIAKVKLNYKSKEICGEIIKKFPLRAKK